MAIQIKSNIDEELEKAERLLNVYSLIKDMQEAEDYLTTERKEKARRYRSR